LNDFLVVGWRKSKVEGGRLALYTYHSLIDNRTCGLYHELFHHRLLHYGYLHPSDAQIGCCVHLDSQLSITATINSPSPWISPATWRSDWLSPSHLDLPDPHVKAGGRATSLRQSIQRYSDNELSVIATINPPSSRIYSASWRSDWLPPSHLDLPDPHVKAGGTCRATSPRQSTHLHSKNRLSVTATINSASS
jgi:hypothetical protein